MVNPRGIGCAATLITALCGGPVLAAEQCRLALLLAVDVSYSISNAEYAVQKRGLAAALASADVRRALLPDSSGYVSLAVYEWSGRNQQHIVLDWTALHVASDLTASIDVLINSVRRGARLPTSMGHSMSFGARMLDRGPNCARTVVDISGDGINNDGYEPSDAYIKAQLQDVTVNGLVITRNDPFVEQYYWQEVVRGPHAFVEVAEGFDDFERAMVQKLKRELEGFALSQSHITSAGPDVLSKYTGSDLSSTALHGATRW